MKLTDSNSAKVMQEKIVVAIVSAFLSGVGVYVTKALTIEGRLDAIEKSLGRIEQRLFPIAKSGLRT